MLSCSRKGIARCRDPGELTIKKLCENADINRSTFYAYYTDQYDLLHKIEGETLSWLKGALADLISKTDKDEMMKVLEKIFQYFVENSKHLKILMSEQGNIDFQKLKNGIKLSPKEMAETIYNLTSRTG